MRAQFGELRSRHGETDGVRVSSKAGEQRGARFERVQQVKRTDGPARAVGFVAIAGNHQRGTAITLDYARGRNSDHSPVPSVAVDHQAEGIEQRGFLLESRIDGIENSALLCLTVAVELVKLVG